MKVCILSTRTVPLLIIFVIIGLILPTVDATGNNILTLEYSTYLGGNGDEGHGILFFHNDSQLIVVSETSSTDYPLVNPLQDVNNGERDIIVSMINLETNELSYSTFFGGAGDDFVSGAIMDSEGNIILVGVTDSLDFPLINPVAINSTDYPAVFIVKFNIVSEAVLFSSYLGKASRFYGIDVAVDSNDNIIITGGTDSTDFYVYDAYQNSSNGGADGFIMKISPDGQNIVFSTYFGDIADDTIKSVTIDSHDNIIFIGVTKSDNFPLVNPYTDTKSDSSWDIFISKLSGNGQNLQFSTYHGGTREWGPADIICDEFDNFIVIGETNSQNIPIIRSYQSSYAGGNYDGFISKFLSNGSVLDFSTFLGGMNDDTPISLTLNDDNDIFITGCTNSEDFPSKFPFNEENNGDWDGFMTMLSSNGQELDFSSYFGGTSSDYMSDLEFIPQTSNSFFITGHCSSRDIPLIDPLQDTYGGGEFDLFISRFTWTPPQKSSQVPAYTHILGILTLIGLGTFQKRR